jgi:PrtD family type I secretion system ABC transporter
MRSILASARKREAPKPPQKSAAQRDGLQHVVWRAARAGLAVTLLLTAFIAVLKLTLPLYIFHLLDRVIASRNIDTLLLLTLIAVFGVLMAAIAEFIRRTMLRDFAGWIESQIGKRLFQLGVSGASKGGPARALERLDDVTQFVAGPGSTTWLDVLFAPAFLLIVWLIHPNLAAIVAIGMVLIVGLAVAADRLTRPRRAEARRARLRGESWVTAANLSPETVSGLNLGERIAQRWSNNAARERREQMGSRMLLGALGEASRLTEVLQRIACYGLGVWLAINGQMTVGGIIAAAVLGRLGTSSVRRAVGNWRQLRLALRSWRRICRLLDTTPAASPALRDPDSPRPLVIDQVTLRYAGQPSPIVSQLDVVVRPGEILAIVGPSGAGKSSLARMITGVAAPTSGAVRLGDIDVMRLTERERGQDIGYLPQHVSLFAATVTENIASLRRSSDRDVVEATRLAEVHDRIMRLPDGYETRLAPSQTLLAGGEIRRLGLARALHGKPRLIVLDEPESHLDDALVDKLMASLDVCRQWGAIVVVTAQTMRLTAIADQVVVLAKGEPHRIEPGGPAGKGRDASDAPVRPARNRSATTAANEGSDP